jgi:release factor glutamine methyltransferase
MSRQSDERTRTTRFGPVEVEYDASVLVPRPWTLEQSTWAAALLGSLPDGPVLEVCAGVGHIGLAANVASGRELVLVDLDERACELARRNADASGQRVAVRRGPMDTVLRDDELFPLVLADPPYIPSRDVGRFPEDPLVAIDGGEDGLALARACLDVVSAHLAADGAALLQLLDRAQVRAVRQHLDAHPSLGLRVVEERYPDGGALVRLARG